MREEQQGRTRKSNKLSKSVDDNDQYGLIGFFSLNVETTKLGFKSRQQNKRKQSKAKPNKISSMPIM